MRDVCPHCERSFQICRGGRLRKHISRGTGKPCPTVTFGYAPPEPSTIVAAERAYAEALAAEHKAVGSLPDRATERQLAHARAASERTDAALRALRAARGEP